MADMQSDKEQTAPPKPDGRLMRSERSREAIVKAMLELIEEGNLSPTAQQTADRASVGIRSVFRHFEDMESIFAYADELTQPRIQDLFSDGDRNGSLSERILHATEQRARGYEAIKQVILSTQARLWRSKVLQKNYERSQRRLRKDLGDWLPEMKNLSRSRREAIEAVTSFENWHRLRQHQSLSKKKSIQVIVEMLTLLIR